MPFGINFSQHLNCVCVCVMCMYVIDINNSSFDTGVAWGGGVTVFTGVSEAPFTHAHSMYYAFVFHFLTVGL